MSNANVPRRGFLKLAALGVAGAALSKPDTLHAAPSIGRHPAGLGISQDLGGLRLGVASYSLRNFPRAKAIEMTKALGTPYINFKSVHLAYDASPAEFAAARHDVEVAGLQIVGGGTITFETDTDDGVRKYFDYAHAAGMPLIVGTCDPKVLPRIEKFVKQYNIKLAIHNHGPEDKFFPSPYDALKAVKGMDPRMGLCVDWGTRCAPALTSCARLPMPARASSTCTPRICAISKCRRVSASSARGRFRSSTSSVSSDKCDIPAT